jgi:hypothetical protein
MYAFRCDTCFHKVVCLECPSSGAINKKCAHYTKVKNVNSAQQPKCKMPPTCGKCPLNLGAWGNICGHHIYGSVVCKKIIYRMRRYFARSA